VRRLVVLGLLAFAMTACGGSDPEQGATPKPVASVEGGVAVNRPTAEQLEFRGQLLAQLESGTYGDCDCNGDERARERISSGKVNALPADSLP
jgi:hypothetical protein